MSGSFNVSNDTPSISTGKIENINSTGLSKSFTISDSSSNFNIQNYNSSIITEEYDVFADIDSTETESSTTDIGAQNPETLMGQEQETLTMNETINVENPTTQTESIPGEQSSSEGDTETINGAQTDQMSPSPEQQNTTPEQTTVQETPAYQNAPNNSGVLADESINNQPGTTLNNSSSNPLSAAAPIGATVGAAGAMSMGGNSEAPKGPAPADIAKPKMPGESKPEPKKDKDQEKPEPMKGKTPQPEQTTPETVEKPVTEDNIIETGNEYDQINEEAENLYDMEENNS